MMFNSVNRGDADLFWTRPDTHVLAEAVHLLAVFGDVPRNALYDQVEQKDEQRAHYNAEQKSSVAPSEGLSLGGKNREEREVGKDSRALFPVFQYFFHSICSPVSLGLPEPLNA